MTILSKLRWWKGAAKPSTSALTKTEFLQPLQPTTLLTLLFTLPPLRVGRWCQIGTEVFWGEDGCRGVASLRFQWRFATTFVKLEVASLRSR